MVKLFITSILSGVFYVAILKGIIEFPPNGSAIMAGAFSGSLCFLSLYILISKSTKRK